MHRNLFVRKIKNRKLTKILFSGEINTYAKHSCYQLYWHLVPLSLDSGSKWVFLKKNIVILRKFSGRQEWNWAEAPLHRAAAIGRNEILRVLVEAGGSLR